MASFRERKKNNNAWFRLDDGVQYLEGTKLPNGDLLLTIKFMDEFSSIKVSRNNVDKLTWWLNRVYPLRSNNVNELATVLSLRVPERDPGPSSPDAG